MAVSFIDIAISAALAASTIVPVFYGNIVSSAERRAADDTLAIDRDTITKLMSRGYAYTVDIGDSIVVVVVFRKSTSKSFAEVEPSPLELMHMSSEVHLEANEVSEG
ncbi:MAG: hypothetical protein DRO12_01745 [Thermoprotei archaeon]|nr:MAG: hypothetical protein DRO12_01745 [Thermoprotei archaeon]